MPAQPQTNSLVNVYVNTAFTPLNQGNIKDHVWFADSDGDLTNNNAGNVENYQTNIKSGGNITWTGAVYRIDQCPSDYVVITNVTVSTNGVLNIKLEPSSSSPTHVNGNVTGNASNNIIDYTIYFSIVHVDESTGTREVSDFSIDPKLQIH